MADLVIRGMEMPTEQRIEVLIFKNGFVAYYDVEGRYIGQAKAVPLPEGHGRLIDADALMPDFAKATWEFRDGYTFQWLLEHAPTIVQAEGGTDNGN